MAIALKQDGFRKAGAAITLPVRRGRGQIYTKLAAAAHRIILTNLRAGGKPAFVPSRAAIEEGRTTLIADGNMFRSITRRGTAAAAIVESYDHRAAIHHFGGTIVPKTAGALTIPIAPEAKGKRAADFPKHELWVLRKNESRQAVLMWGGKALFLLVKSVEMPSRPFMDIPASDLPILTSTVRDGLLGQVDIRSN